MVLGSVLIAAVLGLASMILALMFGHSTLVAVALYPVVGGVTLLGLSLAIHLRQQVTGKLDIGSRSDRSDDDRLII